MTKGEKIIAKLQDVFMLVSVGREEVASKLLQQVFDELQEVK
jgi:hypothetical protein